MYAGKEGSFMSKPLLEVNDLKVEFKSKYETVYAVNGVNFSVYEGETFGLVGESGCGKSQTLRSILGLLKSPGKIVEGTVVYHDKDITHISEKDKRQFRGKEIGLIFQEPMTALNPVLKIKKQIFEAFDKKMKAEQKWKKAVSLMRLVGIPSPEERLEEYPHQFSGGMRQRAMIAIALASEPKLLLADEPTTALDVTIQDQIMKLLVNLKDSLGMSMILVTHDLGVVAQMCDRVAVMYAGYIVEMTDTVTLFAKPRHPYTYALMSSIPNRNSTSTNLETIDGMPPNLTQMPFGCPFAPRCRYVVDQCHNDIPNMKEIEPNHFIRCIRPDITESFKGLIDPQQIGGNK